jgi:hypothetical protein
VKRRQGGGYTKENIPKIDACNNSIASLCYRSNMELVIGIN